MANPAAEYAAGPAKTERKKPEANKKKKGRHIISTKKDLRFGRLNNMPEDSLLYKIKAPIIGMTIANIKRNGKAMAKPLTCASNKTGAGNLSKSEKNM